ncbi:MAG: protein translocase subunit SecD [Patescibacteria group bacterium]|jgi:preprotein translocase subunit SecD|nr:protein translocase subunit SecD [Patescibacteria group bacterium]
MKKKNRIWFRLFILLFLVVVSLIIDWPKEIRVQIPKPIVNFENKSPFVKLKTKGSLVDFKINLKIKEGLDLQGGSSITYSADLSKIPDKDKANAMDSLKKVIENRINAFGLTEPVVRTSKSGNDNRISVELPGVKNTDEAIDLIGKTAQLEFKEYKGQEFVTTGLTGKDLKRATVVFDPNTNKPQISLEFSSDGAKKFEEITGRNVGKPIAIVLDGKIISAPNVSEKITGGNAQITGEFDIKEANALAIQLNAGALPAPIKIIEQRTVGATLGQDSINKSIIAGAIGILAVCIYMLIYYRLLGVFSTIGLALYLIFMLALFKLFGVTLTMGGIAGLILSIGMSMETDVLVFERIREELRNDHSFVSALRLGFIKAWPSIRDSNVVSLIICAILYTAGGMIRGFAIVLALGIIVGLTTTFLGTRTLIDLISRRKFVKKAGLFRVEKFEENL